MNSATSLRGSCAGRRGPLLFYCGRARLDLGMRRCKSREEVVGKLAPLSTRMESLRASPSTSDAGPRRESLNTENICQILEHGRSFDFLISPSLHSRPSLFHPYSRGTETFEVGRIIEVVSAEIQTEQLSRSETLEEQFSISRNFPRNGNSFFTVLFPTRGETYARVKVRDPRIFLIYVKQVRTGKYFSREK